MGGDGNKTVVLTWVEFLALPHIENINFRLGKWNPETIIRGLMPVVGKLLEYIGAVTEHLGGYELMVSGSLGSVTRDSPFRLHVQCSYKGSQESELQVKPRVYTLSPPLPATEAGILVLELRIARDGGYRSWYVVSDYPILSVLRDPVFVEVRVLNRNDPSLVLVLNACWATPTPEPYSGLRWDLLVGRCPFVGDNYKTLLLPVDGASHLRFPTHHNRFVVSTFAFWDRVSGRALTGEGYSLTFQNSQSTIHILATAGITGRRAYNLTRIKDIVISVMFTIK
uniref:zona pellucida sperm-binding protein 4-like n=1 Tax=Pristiophorus japonicus TaxID=55135 RepID=UPI00398E5A83